MKFLCLLLPFALAACGRAEAANPNLPTLSVEYFQQDSARVIARWARPCDGKGCADGYRVQWTAGSVSRVRNTAATVDTLRLAPPAVGDSIVATVSVTSLRRGLSGVTRTAVAILRNPDAPPPAVDSLRADTLAAIAYADTFTWTLRDTNGLKQINRLPGSYTQWCTIAKNKLTGQFSVVVGRDWSVDTQNDIERRCERARSLVASERSG